MNTDAFKVFHSFSDFVKPISNQTKLPQICRLVFSVVPNISVCKMLNLEERFTARRPMERCNSFRSPFFVALKIPDVHFSSLVLFIEVSFHS